MTEAVDKRSLFVDSLFAHAQQFTMPLVPGHSEAIGRRMLIAFALVGIGVFLGLRFSLAATGIGSVPGAGLGFVLTLLLAFAVAQRWLVGAPMADVGLRPFASWTRRERLFFLQAVPMAAVGFAFVFREHLLGLVAQHGVVGFLLFSLLTGVLWGAVQEFIYRGWLQTELTRRYGGTVGLLVANVVFTFGPLHFNYLVHADGPRWGVLAAVFAIGLFFGIVYCRSGNLWIPAVLHGLWPLNMT